jgi:hypothetical protein
MTRDPASAVPPPLPGAFAAPPAAEALRPGPATVALVRGQVRALLEASPAFHALAAPARRELARAMVHVAAYAAECVRDDWYQSGRLGQRPVVRRRQVVEAPVARAQAAGDDFKPAAANQIARITQETLRAIAFPTFVADLIKGTFNAITTATIQQMEAYTQLLNNVGKTVDQFMADNISDNQARDWLAQNYPEHLQVKGGKVAVRGGAEDRPPPAWKRDLNLSDDVDLDADAVEENLVPAARRNLVQSRLQLLSTMVLMGVNRIVITGGKIRATMGFHIDTTDRTHEEHATDFDFRTAASGSFGFGPWSASASLSVSYVSSTRADSDAELNVNADLTGEVDIRFKSDYFPLERFANTDAVGRIRANTAVPEANAPAAAAGGPGAAPSDENVPVTAPRRQPRRKPTLPPIGNPLPAAKKPAAPDAPVVKRYVEGPGKGPGVETGNGAPPPSAAKPAAPGGKAGPAGEKAQPAQGKDTAAPAPAAGGATASTGG